MDDRDAQRIAIKIFVGICLLGLLSLVFGISITAFSCNNPTFFVDEFYVPALNNTATIEDDSSTLIHFDLKIHNVNHGLGLYYDDLHLLFSYAMEGGSIPIGTYVVSKFYQGNGKTKHVRDVVVTHGYSPLMGSNYKPVRELVEGHGVLKGPAGVVFRVDLGGQVKCKSIFDFVKRKMAVGANVVVDYQTGKKVQKKDIELKA